MNNIFFYLFQGLSDESLNINVKFALNYLRKLFNNMANNVIGENIIAIVLNEFDDLKVETLISLMIKFNQNYKVTYEIITVLMEYLLLERQLKPSIESILLNNNKLIIDIIKNEIIKKSNQEFLSALLIYQYNLIFSTNNKCIILNESIYIDLIDESFFNLFFNCKSFLVVDLMQFLYMLLIQIDLNKYLRTNLLYIISITLGTFISLGIDSLIKNDSNLEINDKILSSYKKLYYTFIENFNFVSQEVSVGTFNSGLIQNLILYYSQNKYLNEYILKNEFLIKIFCSMSSSTEITLKELIKLNYLEALKSILNNNVYSQSLMEIFFAVHNLCNEQNIIDDVIKSEIFEMLYTRLNDLNVRFIK